MRKIKSDPEATHPPDDIKKSIEVMVLEHAHDNRLSCASAHEIAATLNVDLSWIGIIADTLKLKVSNCQLGCF